MLIYACIIIGICLLNLSITFILLSRQRNLERQAAITDVQQKHLLDQREQIDRLLKENQTTQFEQYKRFDEHQINSLKLIQDSLQKAMTDVRVQVNASLVQHGDNLGKRVDKLTEETQARLKEISGQVDQRLTQGFEKTTATFSDVMKRLIIIDEAQKKITELSSNVVSLQEILSDKKSRGAFGEVQLSSLISNMIPSANYAMQHTLSNGKRADCILFLPEPTGNVVIDAKFPLEYYQQLTKSTLGDGERKTIEQQFRQVIRKHIQDIAEKYILPGETSDGAIMFIPAESVFAEIHGNYPDLVEYAQQRRVWLTSPTTMMAILTTTRAVLKDAATRKQIHIIQEHLVALSKDFERFQDRMDQLAKHIDQAHKDVEQVHRSSQKISSRFNKIEKVDISLEIKDPALPQDI